MEIKTQQLIKDVRKRLNLSKYKLASILGVSWNTVHSWEKGEYEPTKKRLAQLLKLLEKPDTTS